MAAPVPRQDPSMLRASLYVVELQPDQRVQEVALPLDTVITGAQGVSYVVSCESDLLPGLRKPNSTQCLRHFRA